MEQIKLLKDWGTKKVGDIINISKKGANSAIEAGVAEIIKEEKGITTKEIEEGNRLSNLIKERLDNEPELNYEQRQAIKLEVQNKLPKLAKELKEEGRKKYIGEVLYEILANERKAEQLEEKFIGQGKEEKVSKKYKKIKKEENKIYVTKTKVISYLAKKERRQATEIIVEYIKEKKNLYTIKDDIKSEIWVYDEGIYKPNGKSCIIEICRNILDEHYTINFANEVISKIEADTFIEPELFFKNNYINEIPLENGILNLKTKELGEFNPKKIFFNRLPVKYNPDAVCPNIEKHFKDILKNEGDSKVMFEIFGFLLYKEYFIEKAIMFIGDGRNGKGKTIDLMKRFIGANNCCSVPLTQLSEGGFRSWDLFGNMANLAGDLSSNSLRDTAMLKQTTGRDLIGADRKNKSTINFVNYAKHIFACNELPRVYDFSRGFWERWILFEFPYTFVKEEEFNKLGEQEQKKYRIIDNFIIEKLTTEEELSGLLNKSIEGLHNILRKKDFSYSIGIDELKKFWVRKSDSFTAFTMDNLEEHYHGSLSKRILRNSFSSYCKEHKIKGASDKNIKVVLEEMFGATDRQESGGERIWEGIRLKEKSKYNYIRGKLKE